MFKAVEEVSRFVCPETTWRSVDRRTSRAINKKMPACGPASCLRMMGIFIFQFPVSIDRCW